MVSQHRMNGCSHQRRRTSWMIMTLFISLLLHSLPTLGLKFNLPASRYPKSKCIWNTAHPNALVIVTANVGPGEYQQVDVEIRDSSSLQNVYLSKKNIKGETRFAITSHVEGEIGVCFKNHLSPDTPSDKAKGQSVIIDLEVDIGADAVDYNAIANQESLSGLETEMRKLEGIVKEVLDEMDYLEKREERFSSTNLSTNQRVQNFAWFMLFCLTGLGVWQIFHLRAFFKRKWLID